jgi:hypothetical protein
MYGRWKSSLSNAAIDGGPAEGSDPHDVAEPVERGRGRGSAEFGQSLMKMHVDLDVCQVPRMRPMALHANSTQLTAAQPIQG